MTKSGTALKNVTERSFPTELELNDIFLLIDGIIRFIASLGKINGWGARALPGPGWGGGGGGGPGAPLSHEPWTTNHS